MARRLPKATRRLPSKPVSQCSALMPQCPYASVPCAETIALMNDAFDFGNNETLMDNTIKGENIDNCM